MLRLPRPLFGLNTAPKIFTKILKPVAAFLRKRGVRMILYLDDFIILGLTYQDAQSHTVMAAFLALKSFLKNQSHKVVCLRMDNTAAVAHVNNKGSTHSPCLLALTLELWQWCLKRNMISAQHLSGKLNTIADSESRVCKNSSEWKIDPPTFFPFLKGCEIYLFASRLSAQLPQHVSWRPAQRQCPRML